MACTDVARAALTAGSGIAAQQAVEADGRARELLCDIRREHPSVSVKLILRTLRAEGRVGPEVTACTVRRMFAERGLTRTAAAGTAARHAFAGKRSALERCGTATCVTVRH